MRSDTSYKSMAREYSLLHLSSYDQASCVWTHLGGCWSFSHLIYSTVGLSLHARHNTQQAQRDVLV